MRESRETDNYIRTKNRAPDHDQDILYIKHNLHSDDSSGFDNICYILMYYANTRSIPAKTDFCYRTATSLYKVLCFTETWLTKGNLDYSYFPHF
ncbi:hypothetical protein Bhyg_07881 [Pseudolycoriella hygida]|uniref:Uncharacterized protein n=1 Tax=Pseudolycoriella hygida TaxID=35572 RepID=A0A9Q0S493_9DIPT|nr:hypothetical protein Bhyg_07881 [Pseudolycoriella hygida]